eukprot:9852386-Lingulodinium_polyedra.AAC.1
MKLFAKWGVDTIPQVAPTHWDRHGSRALDVAGVPEEIVHKWAARLRWMRHLSDHALLTAHPNARASYKTRPCTPSAIKSLPPAALDDLKRAFAALEITLQ